MNKRLAALAVAAAAVVGLAAPTATATAAGRTSGAATTVTRTAGPSDVRWYSGGDFEAKAYSDCGGGSCFFQNAGGGGWLWIVPSCGHHVVPSWFDDRASSAWNRTPTRIHIYSGGNYTGYMGTVPGWFQGGLAAAHNDRMSSVFADC
ncbi:peptidase inhibitor family I36 protein [Streptomyces bambusae]|uniref:peptidase inhibitor family I36 protein n=1 Tax=Streptomyces bambusae TaxID=1550616 RepID=UPI001CFC58D0|nr:peptidase inhibitor family I36 protein [Streptomyces bambusae]MCB5165396.1 peptidase inhibitor family I36 protein [Streptomyces bambusae]